MDNRNVRGRFSLFTLGTLIPKISDKVYLIAMPWLIYELTQSSFFMGLMFLVETLPFVIISPLAGIIADRFRYFTILMITLLIQFFGLISISLLLLSSFNGIWLLYLIGFVVCGSGACYWVVYNTAIPAIFKKDELVKANSLFQFSDTLTVVIGASIAAFLINFIGIFNLFLVISFCFLITVLFIIPLKSPLSDLKGNLIKGEGGFISNLNQGLLYIYKHKPLMIVTFIALLGNIANGVLVSMLVYFIRNDLGFGALEINFIYVAGGIAQFISLLFISKLLMRVSSVKLMLVCQFICGMGIFIVGLFTNLTLIMIGFAIQNAAVVIYNITNRTYRQKIVPQELLGRVNGFNQMLVRSAFPLAGFIAGMLVTSINVGTLYAITAIFSMLIVIPFYLSDFRNISDHQSKEISHHIIQKKISV